MYSFINPKLVRSYAKCCLLLFPAGLAEAPGHHPNAVSNEVDFYPFDGGPAPGAGQRPFPIHYAFGQEYGYEAGVCCYQKANGLCGIL